MSKQKNPGSGSENYTLGNKDLDHSIYKSYIDISRLKF